MSGAAASARWLEVSHEIARTIVEGAVWAGDRCSWVGAMPEEASGGRTVMSFRALAADLYGGSAGVGLFLAEVAHATGDEDCRRAAAAALEHAISRAEDLAGQCRLGLYAGTAGVALALALASRTLEAPGLLASALEIACSIGDPSPEQESDLMSGTAGTVLALLALAGELRENRLLAAARAHGEALLAAAQPTPTGLSWPSRSLQGAPGLLGLSHGAAGIAVALLELARVSGEQRFRSAAEAAFAHERALYDRGAANWPDLRSTAQTGHSTEAAFATFWCHGAPGGALARIRALELGGPDELRGEAEAALATTGAWVSAALASEAVNFSYCHGLAGNAEILLEGQQLVPSLGSLVHEVAVAGVSSYARGEREWPSGAYGEPTPSLFLGLAGIGRFYLRLATPALPSLLIIRPQLAA